jgi:decaprenyl-phosphate phosphoribosyltransferase
MQSISPLISLMRPHQWSKNGFVFAGLVFSQSWNESLMVERVLFVFAAFCCMSSAAYILNDWRDRVSDARHPEKFKRPLASGLVSVPAALCLAGSLAIASGMLAANNRALLLLLGIYGGLNVLYSWGLKRVPVVDVSIIAAGFMLRLLAGTLAVGIPPSRWLLLTGLFVALFLGFSKRKAESFHSAGQQRAVMEGYPSSLLDTFMSATMTATILTYSLFATSTESQTQHGERLVYTVPVVIFGLLRYAFQVHRGRGEDVSRDLLRDPWIVLALLTWLSIFLGIRF